LYRRVLEQNLLQAVAAGGARAAVLLAALCVYHLQEGGVDGLGEEAERGEKGG